MAWKLAPYGTGSAEQWITFTPNVSGGDPITFVQTVIAMRGSARMYSRNDTASRRYEAGPEHQRVDHHLHERDPFYGARWDGARWVAEESATDRQAGRRNAPSTDADPAYLYDSPLLNIRHGESQVFETVAVIPKTGKALGALRWGLAYHSSPPYRQLLYGTESDCTDTPSANFDAVLQQFYAAKYDVILDQFESGSASLRPNHRAARAPIVTRLNADSRLHVQCGGAADLSEANPGQLAHERAAAAAQYLLAQGVSAGRIQVVSYGAEWARVQTTPGASEPRNRRVQVMVRRASP